eukprot:m.927095 g.927095  ORF g.927095 m.927095 type:complete len:58 (-) comp145684_c0_seq1:192-365(-)
MAKAREALCTRAFIIVMVVTWFFEERGLQSGPTAGFETQVPWIGPGFAPGPLCGARF